MLIPGIKIAQTEWQDRIKAKPRFAEIWYRVDQPKRYPAILTALQQQNIPFGLHFWGITSTGHETNLAYPGKIRDESIRMMETCLTVAHDWQAVYVTIHSGNTRPIHLSLDNGFEMLPDPAYSAIPDDEACGLRHQALEDLGRLAHTQNTELLIELIPQCTYNHNDRSHPIPEYPASINGLLDLFERRLIGFTNDFCHTFCRLIGQPRTALYQQFVDLTTLFLPYTKLCHINTLYEPYNGADAHGGILESDFAKPGVFPTRSEYQELIRLLQTQPHDIRLVGEPSENHVENYHALQQLIIS